MTTNRFINRSELIGILVLAVFLVVILPLCLDVFRLNLVAKYLTYAFVALGLRICWAYGGILSLGQGVFFSLSGYCMAMFLKLEASSPENQDQSTPAFQISWTGIRSPNCLSSGSHSRLTLTVVPSWCRSSPSSWRCDVQAASQRRSLLHHQAIAAILTILIVGPGLHRHYQRHDGPAPLKGWDLRPDHARSLFLRGSLPVGCIFIAQFVRHRARCVKWRCEKRTVRRRLQRRHQDLALCVAAIFPRSTAYVSTSGRFMSPSLSASHRQDDDLYRGGRPADPGAVYGTMLVNFAKTSLSESFPELWLFGLGGLFIAVVLAFPNGLAGIWGDYVQPRIDRLINSRKPKAGHGWTDSSVADGAPAE